MIFPSVGSDNLEIIFSSVVLPEPLSPWIPIISPLVILISIQSKIF